MKSDRTTDWKPYPNLGSFFRLDRGILMECPMNDDGSRGDDDEASEVEWDYIESVTPEEKEKLEQVCCDLSA